MDDLEKQEVEWRKFAATEEAKGRCPHSGLAFGGCKASICDCFDYPGWRPEVDQINSRGFGLA